MKRSFAHLPLTVVILFMAVVFIGTTTSNVNEIFVPRQLFRICGGHVHSVVHLVCNGSVHGYNNEKRAYYPGLWKQRFNLMYNRPLYKRQIVQECCYRLCQYEQLLTYCKDASTVLNRNRADIQQVIDGIHNIISGTYGTASTTTSQTTPTTTTTLPTGRINIHEVTHTPIYFPDTENDLYTLLKKNFDY